MPQIGDMFADRYRLTQHLGTGGFAQVYRAEDTKDGRTVALKLLQLTDETAAKRFALEARVIVRLEHPCFVDLYDHGVASGLHFMALEFVAGETLRQYSTRVGPMSPEVAVELLGQALSGLASAHASGVLHRDIKPDNIMLTEGPEGLKVRLLDLGIAKILSDGPITAVAPLTAVGRVVGTPRYIAPEVLRGADFTPSSDLFSLGVCAYEALLGRRLVDSDDPAKVMDVLAATGEFDLPTDHGQPQKLLQFILCMLAKNPTDRFASAHAALAELKELPQFAAATMLIGPQELAEQLRAADLPDDVAQTVVDSKGFVQFVDNHSPPEAVTSTAPMFGTPSDVNAAVVRLRADAEAKALAERPAPVPTRAPRPTATPEPDPVLKDEVRAPRATSQQAESSLKDKAGFIVLGVAVLAAVLHFGIKTETVIREGHALTCGFARVAIVTEQVIHLFGVTVTLESSTECVDPS